MTPLYTCQTQHSAFRSGFTLLGHILVFLEQSGLCPLPPSTRKKHPQILGSHFQPIYDPQSSHLQRRFRVFTTIKTGLPPGFNSAEIQPGEEP